MERKQAIEQGLKIYMADKPCKFGHVARRYTSSGTCVACGDMRRAQVQRSVANAALKWRETTIRVPVRFEALIKRAEEELQSGDVYRQNRLESLMLKAFQTTDEERAQGLAPVLLERTPVDFPSDLIKPLPGAPRPMPREQAQRPIAALPDMPRPVPRVDPLAAIPAAFRGSHE